MTTSKRLARRRNAGWTPKRLTKHQNFRPDADSCRFIGVRPSGTAVRSGETVTPGKVAITLNDDGTGAQGASATRAGQSVLTRSFDSFHARGKMWAPPPARKTDVEGS